MSRYKQTGTAPGGTYPLGSFEVARIGYGAMQLSKLEGDPAKAEAILRRALELGVDHFDTAHFYGDGFVNRMLGRVLSGKNNVVIASKVGADPDPQAKIPIKLAQHPKQLRATVEDNLLSLGMERIPLVNLRRADIGPGVHAEADQIVNIDDQMAEMIAMRQEGKIANIGLSGVDTGKILHVLPAGIACVQNAYSLMSRDCEDALAVCLEHGVAWVPFFPLGGAAPGWPKVTEQPKVIDIAKRLGITPSQVGLAWLLSHSPNTLLIPGTTDLDHLQENLASASAEIDKTLMSELDDLWGNTARS